MSTREFQVAIIGAGPAGLSAAAETAEQGIQTVVLDMYSRAGGQYYHLPPDEFSCPAQTAKEIPGKKLEQQARDAGAEIWNGCEVWGIYPEDGFLIGLSGAEEPRIRAQKVIIAVGAIERAVPFPGWTLPGVMTPGGAMALLKHQRVLAGREIVLAGTGPLQLAAAAYLSDAGAAIKAVLEQHHLLSMASYLPLISDLARVKEGWSYISTLRQKGVFPRLGWTVLRAEGKERVEAAVISRLDRKGRVIPGTEQHLEADLICQGFGLQPATRLSRVLGCDHKFHPISHCFTPLRDEWLQTSIPGSFVSGDAAEIIGKEGALLEGKLAAIAVSHQLGKLNQTEAAHKAQKLRAGLKRERFFAKILNLGFLPEAGIWDRIEDDTIICRCEQVSLAQIKQAISDGMDSFAGVKNHTRAGMGWCQGRTCWMNAAQVIANEMNISLENASRHTVRPPVFPVVLGDLLE